MENKEPQTYTVTHIGEGKFNVTLDTGEIKEAGPNLCGMIRYVYFEDYTLPEIGWNVTNKKLWEDYQPKAAKDIADGKLKPNQINY